jgi:16S rRNA (guanine527-N7)-methyltransferase
MFARAPAAVRPEPFGPAEFQAASNVSRETLGRLKLFAGLLEDWNARLNLVSATSLSDVWRRHIWDSAQLADWAAVPGFPA